MEHTFDRLLGPDDEGRRLETIVRKVFPDIPLSALHKALRTGKIKVDGKKRKPDYICSPGQRLEAFSLKYRVRVSETRVKENRVKAARLPGANVLFPEIIVLETDDLLFLNKPMGLLVHDGLQSLEALVDIYLKGRNEHSVSFKPGPLHRLDRNTSGLIAFSKTLRGATAFSSDMRESRIRKTYLAMFEGEITGPEDWEDTLSRDETGRKSEVTHTGRRARTCIVPIASAKGMTFAEVRLETGRTHQIRAQAQAHEHPLAGDVKYGGKALPLPYYLHAWKLEIENPTLPGVPASLAAPLPNYFREFLSEAGVAAENGVYSYLYNSDY